MNMDRHNKAVAAISERVKDFYQRKEPFKIYHGSTNSTRIITFDPKKVIDTSRLNHVISIDKQKMTAIVEPNVPMDRLVEATLSHGLVPPVVPEFPGITVGGSFSGTAGESSSFKYGFFDRTVNWCQIILANGDIVKASATENSDLFYGAVGAFGTLGVTTLFNLQLIQAKPFVEVAYVPVSSVPEAVNAIKTCAAENYDFIDGIMYGLRRGVIITGRLTDSQVTPKSQRFTRAQDPWFYMHAAEKSTSASKPVKESKAESAIYHKDTVPLQDYLFRYDRGAFWMGRYSFYLFPMPFNRITRFMLNPLLTTRRMYAALHHSGQSQCFIIQDLALPAHNAGSFIDYVHGKFNIYPLWLCPLKAESPAPLHAPPRNVDTPAIAPTPPLSDVLINVGVWGAGPGYDDKDFATFVADNRELEAKVHALGGTKWLYAHSYYTEDEFWSIYDRTGYEVLRAKWHALTLPGLWEKVSSRQTPTKTTEVRGVLLTMLRKNHLLGRKK